MIGNITRLVNFLEKLNYKPITISRNNSYYYKINNIELRISDHLPGSNSLNMVCILVPQKGNGFSLFIDKSLYVISSLAEMKMFLYHFIILTEGISLKKVRQDTWNYTTTQSSLVSKIAKIQTKSKEYKQQITTLITKCSKLKSLNKQYSKEIAKLNNKIKELKNQIETKNKEDFAERSETVGITNYGSSVDIYRLNTNNIKKSLLVQLQSILRKVSPIKTIKLDMATDE